MPRLIVKVQLPVVSTDAAPHALIYSRSRSVQCEVPVTGKVRKALQGKLKSFWYARLVPDPKKSGAFLVSLDRIAPRQEW